MLVANVCGDAKAFSTGRASVPWPMGVLTLENSAAPCPEGTFFPQEDGWRQAGGKQGWKVPDSCRGHCRNCGVRQGDREQLGYTGEDTPPPRSRLSQQPVLLQPSKFLMEVALEGKGSLPSSSSHSVHLQAADALDTL